MGQPMRDSHRLCLQAFMSRGILASKEVKELYRMACERYDEPADDGRLVEFVRTINANIQQQHLVIQKGTDEQTGAQFYSLVNTAETEVTRLASDYTVNQLELFKKIIEQIVENEDGRLSSTEALNLTQQLDKKMSKQDADDLLKRMQADHWLTMNGAGEVALSTRSLLELGQYLEDQFPNQIVKCNMCRRVCMQGQACDRCDIKIHLHCATRYFQQNKKLTCPACHAPWTRPLPTRPGPSPSKGSQRAKRS